MKNRARRIVLFGAVVASLLVAAVTAAVSQGKTNAQATPAAQEVSGSIRLAGWTSGGSTEGVLLKQVLAGFAKKYPKPRDDHRLVDPQGKACLLHSIVGSKDALFEALPFHRMAFLGGIRWDRPGLFCKGQIPIAALIGFQHGWVPRQRRRDSEFLLNPVDVGQTMAC